MQKPEIMTVQEVAEYLRVSERTVYEWASHGTIPCGKLGTTWRFKRSEVEKWIDEQLHAVRKPVSFAPMNIREALRADNVVIFELMHKDEALMAILNRMEETGTITNKAAVAEGIFQRERLMSTGIGLGIGIPHVRMEGIETLVMGVGLSRRPIEDYESLDDRPVRLLFMILAGKDQHTLHIKMMAAISNRIRNPLLRASIFDAPSEEHIYRLLTEEGPIS